MTKKNAEFFITQWSVNENISLNLENLFKLTF